MTQRRTTIAGLVMLGLCAAGAAQAQYFYGPRDYAPQDYGPRYYDRGLPPFEVMRIVRSTGLAPLTRPMRVGATYVVVATNRSGGQMRVVIDAASGRIMTVNPMVAMRPGGAEPFYPGGAPAREDLPGTYGMGPAPRYDGAAPPVPPRDVPYSPPAPMGTLPPAGSPTLLDAPRNPRVAAPPGVAPPALASAPARTPLPRPRPKVAANPDPAASAPAPVAAAPAPAPRPAAPALVPTPTAPAIINPTPSAPTDGATQMVPVAPLE